MRWISVKAIWPQWLPQLHIIQSQMRKWSRKAHFSDANGLKFIISKLSLILCILLCHLFGAICTPWGLWPTRECYSSGLKCFKLPNYWLSLLRFQTGEIILLHSLWKAFSQRMDSGVNMNGNICYICSNSFLTCILNPLLFTVLQHRFLPSFSNVQFFWIYKCIYEDRNRKVASCLSCGLDDSKKEFRSLYTLS